MSRSFTGALKFKQRVAVASVVGSPSLVAAAAKAGISVATLKRWLKQPEFRGAVITASRQVAEAALLLVQRLMLKAAVVLEKQLDSDDPNVARGAVKIVLDTGVATYGRMDQKMDVFHCDQEIEQARFNESIGIGSKKKK